MKAIAGAAAAAIVVGSAVLLLAWSPLRAVPGSPAAESPNAFGAPALLGQPRQGSLVRGRAAVGTVALELDGKPVALAADRRFIIGFDRDHGPKARLVARSADGRGAELAIAVSPRSWRLEHIDAARRPGGPTEAYLRLRETELARIAAARARSGDSDGWQQAFIWPSRGRISGVFGSQRVYRGEPASFHSGVDVAPGAGALVVAPADGVIVLAGPPAFSLEGNLVIVDHGMGLNSAFLHLASTSVREGQRVRQGDPIGTVGATGRATGPHLHWSMKWREARIDPQPLAGPMQP